MGDGWMSQFEKLFAALMCGTKDKGFLFSDLQAILARLGFQCRIKGDHYIYTRDGIDEIINIQPVGNKAKPYQVKQVRNIVLKYHFGGDIDEI
jgi:virulence-associated protein VapD